MDAYTSSGASRSPTGDAGFSLNARIFRPSDSGSITPNWFASEIEIRIPATVTAAPDSTCWSTMWPGSMR